MMNKRNVLLGVLLVAGIIATSAFTSNTNLPTPFEEEEVQTTTQNDTIPLDPRYGDFINDGNNNPFDLDDPSIIKQDVEFDPATGNYIITERMGEEYFRMPTYLTFEEYLEYRRKKQETEYFQELRGVGKGKNGLDGDDPLSKIDLENSLSDRLFGGAGVDIQVQGNIDMFFGLSYQYTDNPAWPLRQRRQGPLFLFRFDDLQMNVDGQIGDKLNFSTNYNAQATFDFDNQMKLEYASDAFSEDDIIKTIEAGNVSLPLQGSLIQGAQNLFGLKTQLQFGHVYVTAIASQQKSEREEIEIKGGSQIREFEVGEDEYDVNRHFFLSHFNRDGFEESLETLPQVKSLFKIKNIQVWITNDRSETTQTRDIVALTDLGESTHITNTAKIGVSSDASNDINGNPLPTNDVNNLADILALPEVSNIEDVNSILRDAGLKQSVDFEKTQARMLRQGSDYIINKELGFVSLNINVQPYQTIGVAYQYSYNGEFYEVGQLSKDAAATAGEGQAQQVLFVKMLKATTPNVKDPIWDLMMKNVYNIGAYQADSLDFNLDIFYEDPGKGQRRFISEGGEKVEGVPLLQVFNLDRLNSRDDPFRDGAFDYVSGITIYPRSGRIMFPVLEPFGEFLERQFDENLPEIAKKYSYPELYDQTVTAARNCPERSRFTLKGRYRNSISSEISLGAFNIPPGSVIVTGPGGRLIEGQDYEIDYNIGRIKILRDDILASGQSVRVSFEDNTLFGLQTKTLVGLRADYKPSDNFNLGATYMHLFERPLTQKVNIGDDPINNKIYGMDLSFTADAPWLTRAVDKIPFIDTKAPSSISFFAEAAGLKPGHSKAVNEVTGIDSTSNPNRNRPIVDQSGVVYLDDFEGSVNPINLLLQPQNWQISSVPQNADLMAEDQDGFRYPMFQESDNIGTDKKVKTGVNRARLNWYRIFQDARNLEGPSADSNAYTRLINIQEVFPNRQNTQGQRPTLQTFDLTYTPDERGAYNFDVPNGGTVLADGTSVSKGLDSDGSLLDPATRWGGIMKSLPNINDFERSNVEYMEIWVMSPFLEEPSDNFDGGDLYIDLGNVSEDILRDSRKSFENGLPVDDSEYDIQVDMTEWGGVPRSRQIVNAFDNTPEALLAQDLGLDGMDNNRERSHYDAWLQSISSLNANALNEINDDPSNDDFIHFRDYEDGTPVLQRFSRFNKTQGNTPPAGNNTLTGSATIRPDNEDLNTDQTLSETESYFQYHIPIRRKEILGEGNIGMDDDGKNYITDERIIRGDGGEIERIWYRLKVPLNIEDASENARGGIQDFRSIRFVRMYMTAFEQAVTLRFARFDLVRSQWRRYEKDLENFLVDIPDNQPNATEFDVNAVNIEENGERLPFNYVLPEGIRREQNIGVFTALQNEQSLSLTVRNLQHEDSRSIFKNINFDMRNYENLKMFIHAEDLLDTMGMSTCMSDTPEDGDLSIFIRLGSDFKENYYEYEMPLTFSEFESRTTPGVGRAPDSDYRNRVWRPENNLDISLDWFIEAKKAVLEAMRSGELIGDSLSFPNERFPTPESIILPEGHRLSIAGRPNLGYVKSFMIGVRNTSSTSSTHCGEIWVNELRLSGLNEQGGYAAEARMDVQLADFGAFKASTTYNSIGFGSLDQRLQERALDETLNYDMALDLALGKFLPESSGVQIPFYAAYSNTTITPKFDPYDLDIELDDKLADAENVEERTKIKKQAQQISTTKNYGFTDVRKQRNSKPKKNGKQRKPMPWDISNFSATYSYSEEDKSDPFIESSKTENTTGILDYSYSRRPNYIKPFKKLPKNEWIKFLRDLNFNPLPNSVNFSTILDRDLETISYRFTEEFEPQYQTYLSKQFAWDREYSLTWDFSKALKVNFDASNRGVIDEFDESSDAYWANPVFGDDLLKERRNAITTGLQEGGRTKNYNHSIDVNYTLPTKLFPFLDWTKFDAQYEGSYAWDAASTDFELNPLPIGNVIQNSQRRKLTANLDFEDLYEKSDYLKKINRPGRGNKRTTTSSRSRSNSKLKKDGKEEDDKKKKKREPSATERAIIRPLMFLRKARLNYTETFATVIPGFNQDPQLLGMNSNFSAPGWNFVAGWQPAIRTLQETGGTNDWLNNISNVRKTNGQDSWITSNLFLNQEVIQEYKQDFNAKVTLEPIPDFRIDIDASRQFQESYSESFKDTGNGEWDHYVGTRIGSLNMSYYSLQTLFDDDLDQIIDRFQTFRASRANVSQRIGEGVHLDSLDRANGHTFGFGAGQQDVLLASFLAVYTGKDPNTVEVSDNYAQDVLFKQLPYPNWRVQYNGLAKVPFFKDIFQQVGITHAYTSKISVNNFQTDIKYDNDDFDPLNDNGNFFSRLEIPVLSIQEAFSPLIGVEVQTLNDISLSLNINKNRKLSTDFQSGLLSEQQAFDVTFGFGWLMENVDIGFLQNIVQQAASQSKDDKKDDPNNQQTTPFGNNRGGGGGGANPGDLNINFDFSLRDDVTFIYQLESRARPQPERGTRAISISPNIEYQIHEQLAVRLFVDYSKTVPKVSSSFPITSARGGLVIRFMLQ